MLSFELVNIPVEADQTDLLSRACFIQPSSVSMRFAQ